MMKRLRGSMMGVTLLSVVWMGSARADVPAPDNIVYGTIQLTNGVAVTATDTRYSVEARRVSDDGVVSSYRMGDKVEAGNFYVLTLPVEELAPTVGETSVLTNMALSVRLLFDDQELTEASYVVPERGRVVRLDFGAPLEDADGNGIPDIYELIVLGRVGNDPNADTDGDGASDGDEYVAGTNPHGGPGSAVAEQDDLFLLRTDCVGGDPRVTFFAHAAEGIGYAGKTRHYGLVCTTNNELIWVWQDVAGFTNIIGAEQEVVHESTSTNGHAFYRGRVWLSAP